MPASRLDPVMKNFLERHTPDSPTVGYLWPHFLPSQQDEWQLVNKGDYNAGRHAIMGRYIYAKRFGPAFNRREGHAVAGRHE